MSKGKFGWLLLLVVSLIVVPLCWVLTLIGGYRQHNHFTLAADILWPSSFVFAIFAAWLVLSKQPRRIVEFAVLGLVFLMGSQTAGMILFYFIDGIWTRQLFPPPNTRQQILGNLQFVIRSLEDNGLDDPVTAGATDMPRSGTRKMRGFFGL
jgi:hypothetical protein